MPIPQKAAPSTGGAGGIIDDVFTLAASTPFQIDAANRHAAIGWIYTPTVKTALLIASRAQGHNSTVAGGVRGHFRYGTGVPPALGAAETGTLITPTFGNVYESFPDLAMVGRDQATGDSSLGFTAVITGLTISVAYWFDYTIGYTSQVGNIQVKNMSAVLIEV